MVNPLNEQDCTALLGFSPRYLPYRWHGIWWRYTHATLKFNHIAPAAGVKYRQDVLVAWPRGPDGGN
ncbi:hypothetical protein PSAC2689_30275 [Paraburkholderia sacchari]